MTAPITTPIQAVTVFDVDGQPIITSTTGLPSNGYVWNPDTLTWDRMEQPTIEGETINVNVSGPIAVTGTFWQATQPVSAATLPLPSGAATSAKQDTIIAALASVPVTGPLTDAQLRAVAVPVSGAFYQDTQPVSAAALPLPSGASTEATLLLTATEATLALVKAKTDNLDVALSTRIKPADTLAGVTTVGAVTSITNPVAVTNANLDVALSTRLKAADTLAGVTTVSAVTTITNPVAVTGSFYPATQPVSIETMPTTPVTGTFWQATQPVSGTVSTVAGALTSIASTRVEITASGVPQQLTSQACASVRLTASRRNKGTIVVGDSSVVEAWRDRTGIELRPGDSASFPVANANILYICGSRPLDALSIASLA